MMITYFMQIHPMFHTEKNQKKLLKNIYDVHIRGIEPSVKPVVQNRVRSKNKVLVLATNLTLREEKFHNLVKKIDHHDIVEFLALPGLVELAEKFEFRKEKVIPYLK